MVGQGLALGGGLGWGHPRVGGTWQWDRAADGLWLEPGWVMWVPWSSGP